MRLYSNDLMLLLSLLTAHQQFDQWRVLWGDTVESKVDVIDQTVDSETSVIDEVESRIDVLSPTLLDSDDISSGVITISSAGNYRLRTDVSASIQIQASFVDLDLNNRVVLGGVFVPVGNYDYIAVHDGIFLPPADTPISDLYGAWSHTQSDFITFKNLVIVCDDATENVVGRSGFWVDGANVRIQNCLIVSGSALVGGGQNGGEGIRLRLNTTNHPFVENATIITGDGGSNAGGNGGRGGHGILLNNGRYAVIKRCQILKTGNGGSASATGGNGGNGIQIDTAAQDALVIDCTIKNTGVGGSGSPSGSAGLGVDDNSSADQDYVIRCRAHNVSGFKFSLENSGLEDGVQLTYPPDATAVNAYADVYVS